MTAPRTPEAQPRMASRTAAKLYQMLTVGIVDIEDPMARAVQLLAVRDTVREALAEIDEEIDCAVSEVMTSEDAPTYDVAAAVLGLKRATVQDHARRGRAARDRYDGKG